MGRTSRLVDADGLMLLADTVGSVEVDYSE